MTIRLNPRWLLVSTLMFSLQFCRAQVQVPSSISFDLGPNVSADSALWDVSGSYSLDLVVHQRSGIDVPIQLSFSLIQDASGKLTTVSNDIQGLTINGNSFFTITPQVSGKVTGIGGVARVHFTVRFRGSGNVGGVNDVPISGSLSVDSETDAESDQLIGVKSKFSASLSGFSSLNGQVDFSSALPPGIDGSWNLTLQIVALSKIGGTATIDTHSRTLGFDLSGKFKAGTFKIKAMGANDVQDAQNGSGSSATILLSDPFDSITSFTGKILGQKMSFSNVSTGG